jgi:hypothetical protein
VQRKPLDPTAFIDQLREEMRTELAAMDTALPDWPGSSPTALSSCAAP